MNYEEVQHIIDQLEKSPIILKGLLEGISADRIKERRIEDKWSIHEQVCHLVHAQDILMERFRRFYSERNPHIANHDPNSIKSDDFYAQMNYEYSLTRFPEIRKDLVDLLRSYPDDYWDLMGSHDAFDPYGTKILLMHTLNVDFAHFFSIEQLGLTKEKFVEAMMLIP